MYNMAVVLEDLGQLDSARAQYQEVQKQDPSNHRCLVNLAAIAYKKGLHD